MIWLGVKWKYASVTSELNLRISRALLWAKPIRLSYMTGQPMWGDKYV